MEYKQQEKNTIKGIHTFRAYDLSTPEAQEIDNKISTLISQKYFIKKEIFEFHYNKFIEALQKFKTRELVVENIVPLVGRSVFAQILIGTYTYTGTINYGALGSSSTAPNNADIKLGTEVFRKVVASSNVIDNVAFIDFYFTKADTNGTYTEWGTFIDGTGSANSGQIFSHALTGGWSKLATESMTISTTYTFN